MKNGEVVLDDAGKPILSVEEIYSMRPEHAEYDYERFEDRLKGIIKIVRDMESRATEDYELVRQYIAQYPVSYQTGRDSFNGRDQSLKSLH